VYKLQTYDHLHKFSLCAHYENVERLDGRDATLIRMVRGLDRWFWTIPLTDTRTSVGVVMDTSTFRAAINFSSATSGESFAARKVEAL